MGVTIIKSPDKKLSKTIFKKEDGVIKINHFDNPYYVNHNYVDDISTIEEFSDLLTIIEKYNNVAIIRGKVKDEFINSKIRRTIYPEPNCPAYLDRGNENWIMIDLDAIPCPPSIHMPQEYFKCIDFATQLLPTEFHDTSLHFQFSASQGLDNWKTIRLHLFFMLDRNINDLILHDWAMNFNKINGKKIIDPAVYVASTPNYTALPSFVGMPDPCPIRSGLYLKKNNFVNLTLPEIILNEQSSSSSSSSLSSLPVGNSDGDFLFYLCRIGDDYDGFWEPMNKAIFHYFREYGISADENKLKEIIKKYVKNAKNNKGRNLENDYLSEKKLNTSIRGAKNKLSYTQEQNKKQNKKQIRSPKRSGLRSVFTSGLKSNMRGLKNG